MKHKYMALVYLKSEFGSFEYYPIENDSSLSSIFREAESHWTERAYCLLLLECDGEKYCGDEVYRDAFIAYGSGNRWALREDSGLVVLRCKNRNGESFCFDMIPREA